MFALTATPLDASRGTVELTVGAVMSVTVPVVKLHVLVTANALPGISFAPVVTVAV
jgi:hypothetical protein